MQKGRLARWTRVTLLAAMSATSGAVYDGCGFADIPQNFVAGTQAFVKGYTTSFWNALFPSPEELLNLGDDE